VDNCTQIGLYVTSVNQRRKPWSSGRALGSRSEGRGFNPCPMPDGSGVKACQDRFLHPDLVHY